MSVLPSQPLRNVTSSCALPSGGTLNLSHTPWPSLSLISAAWRLLRRQTLLTLARLPRDFIVGAATAAAGVAACALLGFPLRTALGAPPRKAEDVGAKLEDRQQHHKKIMTETTAVVLRLLSLVEAPILIYYPPLDRLPP